MKKWFLIILNIILVLLIIIFLKWVFTPLFEKNVVVLSPLPQFLSLIKNDQVTSLSLWNPSFDSIWALIEKKPDVRARSALLYDLTSKKILFSKDMAKKLPMASLTKIMTAIVALEHQKDNDQYLVSANDLVGENSMGLTPGEILPLKDLLYGTILLSGNDAAEVLASNYKEGRDAFIKAMNDKAKSLGLTNTSFTNPTGLQGDGDQYTTAYDLLVITNYALSNFPAFREVAATFQRTIDQNSTHKSYYLENDTNLLTSYPGVKGVKTGFTPEAGLCLVTYLEYGGHKIIGVLLGSENRRDEMKEMLNYGLLIQGITPPKTP